MRVLTSWDIWIKYSQQSPKIWALTRYLRCSEFVIYDWFGWIPSYIVLIIILFYSFRVKWKGWTDNITQPGFAQFHRLKFTERKYVKRLVFGSPRFINKWGKVTKTLIWIRIIWSSVLDTTSIISAGEFANRPSVNYTFLSFSVNKRGLCYSGNLIHKRVSVFNI